MNIRELLEALEESCMNPYASFSSRTRGRDKPEPPCDMRPEYQRDGNRTLYSKAFRRLKHKTWVFLTPEGDHYRTRLTHTLEVSQITRTIAKTLKLNKSLTEAIALGHDLGHTPLGHSGEHILNKICGDGSAHYQQSTRIVEILGKGGKGLNLTREVEDGILNHRTSGHSSIPEGVIVHLSDKITYINHDVDDAIRTRTFTEDELPGEYTDTLGRNVRECLNNMIRGIILSNMDKPAIIMSKGMEEAMQRLRRQMSEDMYKNEIFKAEEGKAQNMIRQLYECYMSHVDGLPMEYVLLIVSGGEKESRVVCDYIVSVSDIYTIDQLEELFVPRRWNIYWIYEYGREIISRTIPMKSQKK